ncbi:MAG: hypothetical protein EOO77_01655 [Oxalobacteraceae bacterium]|nr:MAG: hypothetical protein EOO77_01655 [Oxalobacteraceae bacterium]
MRRLESWIALEAEALADRIEAHRAEQAAITKASRTIFKASRTVIERTAVRVAASRKLLAPRSRNKG